MKIIIDKKRDVRQFLFLAAFAIMCSRSVIGLSTIPNDFGWVSMVCGGMFLIKAVGDHLRKMVSYATIKEYVFIILFGLVSIVVYMNSEINSTIWLFLVVLASKGVEKDAIYKATFWSMGITVVIVMLLSSVGLIENFYHVNTYTGKICIAFGFRHYNGFNSIFTILIILYFVNYFEKMNQLHCLFILILSFIVYILTNGKTGLLVNIFISIILFIIKSLRNKVRAMKLIGAFIIGMTLLVIMGSILYNQFSLFHAISQLMSGRLQQAHFYYEKYGLTLFGTLIEELQGNYKFWHYMLDCGHMRLLVNYGVLYFILFEFFNFSLLIKSILSGNCKLFVMISAFILYGCSENYISFVFMNVSLLLFYDILFREGESIVELRTDNTLEQRKIRML